MNFTADFDRKNQGRVGETVCICSDGGGVGVSVTRRILHLLLSTAETHLRATLTPQNGSVAEISPNSDDPSELNHDYLIVSFFRILAGPRPTVPARRRQSEDVSKQKKDRKREQFIQKRPNREITHSSFIFCFISLSAARLLYACLVWVIPTGRGNVFQKHLN